MPVRGRLLTGVGEISDAGVHSRGLTLATAGRGAGGRAGQRAGSSMPAPFRGYGNVLIIDHGRGWTTVITGLATLDVARGATVARGASLGRAGGAQPARHGRAAPRRPAGAARPAAFRLARSSGVALRPPKKAVERA